MGILKRSETGLTGLGDFGGTLTWGFAPGFGRPALQALVAGGPVVSCEWEVEVSHRGHRGPQRSGEVGVQGVGSWIECDSGLNGRFQGIAGGRDGNS